MGLLDLLSIHWWLSYILEAYDREPHHVLIEVVCILTILFLVFRKSYDPRKEAQLSKREKDELIDEWSPEPLCPTSEFAEGVEPPVVASYEGSHVLLEDGRRMLHFSSFNFLSLADTADVKRACRETIDKYGVGSCGPRGFYGTIDVHLDLEKEISNFVGTPETILYSDGLGCISSVIPAFSKRGDICVCDEGVHSGIQQGLQLAHSSHLYFKHNDMDDLERVLTTLQEKDDLSRVESSKRKFIIVEGIYQNYGDVCNFSRVMELAKKYKYRLILDDSLALGVLGKTGRGSPERWNIPVSDIDLYVSNLDAAFATTGGFCTGNQQAVDHQRLSGAGYCFSASSPPFSSRAGIVNIRAVNSDPRLSAKCRENAAYMRKLLRQTKGLVVSGGGNDKDNGDSPVIHLRVPHAVRSKATDDDDMHRFKQLAEKMEGEGILIDIPQYIPAERNRPSPSIRVLVSNAHNTKDMDQYAAALNRHLATI